MLLFFPLLVRRAQFDSKVKRVEENIFDDVSKTKMAEKEKRRGGRFGFYSFGGADNRVSSDSSGDEASEGALTKRRVTIGGAVDAMSDDEPQLDGACGPHRSYRRYGAFAVPGLAVDLRKASEGGLPDGLEVVGGEAAFEEQEDGASALIVPEGGYMKLSLPGMSPWQLEEDGRLHRYSLLFAMRLDRLP